MFNVLFALLAQAAPVLPAVSETQLLGAGTTLLHDIQSGQWWSVLSFALAAIPWGVAYLVKRYGKQPWMQRWYVHVLIQAVVAGGEAVSEAVLAGTPTGQAMVTTFLQITAQSLLGWLLLHMSIPAPQSDAQMQPVLSPPVLVPVKAPAPVLPPAV